MTAAPNDQTGRPRMPASAAEALRVFRRYDRLNGRYYFVADVVLEDGRYLSPGTFDADSRTAVEYDRRPIFEQADLIGKAVVAYLVAKDQSAGTPTFGEATEEQRRRFREERQRD